MTHAYQQFEQREYSEKRNFHRMTLNTDIEITMCEDGKVYSALCLNLSGAGLMFRVKEPIPEGATCKTVIKSGNDMTKDLKATLKVVRCASNGPDSFVAGAEIIEFK